jgi:hypothetical protein
MQNEELHSLYSSSIITVIKSRRVRGAGHVARIGLRGMRKEVCWESPKE